jgi:hypothetical protein
VVQWYRDNVMIDDSHEIIQDGARVRNQLLVNKVNRNDLFAVFRCQAFNTNASIPVMSKVILDINRKFQTYLYIIFCHYNAIIGSTNSPMMS